MFRFGLNHNFIIHYFADYRFLKPVVARSKFSCKNVLEIQ
jgi:hypothetical protein